MTDKFNITQWAEKRTITIAEDIKSYIDCGLDFETAVDKVFDGSILAMPYKMQALSLCDGYRHSHKWTTDKVTGRVWCSQCQEFKNA